MNGKLGDALGVGCARRLEWNGVQREKDIASKIISVNRFRCNAYTIFKANESNDSLARRALNKLNVCGPNLSPIEI